MERAHFEVFLFNIGSILETVLQNFKSNTKIGIKKSCFF